MRILLIIAVLWLCSCSKKPETSGTNITKEDMEKEAKRYEILAAGICDCSRDLIVMLKEIQNLEDKDKEEEYKKLKKGFDEEAKASEVCIQRLKKENSKENEMDEVMMDNALKEYCNDFYNMLKVGRIN